MKQLCVISAPPDTYSGYGARSRDLIKAVYELKKDEWDIKILSQRWGATPWGFIEDNKEEWGWMKDLILHGNQLPKQPDVWFQITVPNEFQPVGKVNIGVTAGIETTICDAGFIEGCNRMTTTLVSSKHAKQVLEATTYEERDQATNAVKRSIKIEKPIEVLFEGADLNKYFHIAEDSLPKTDLVTDLNTIKEDFCYLYVGHWLHGDLGEDRKNTGLLVKLFLETFKDKKKQPALIMKTSHGGASIMDREEVLKKIDLIRNSVQGKNLPNIYLVHGDMDDVDINHLYNHKKVKAFVSLTKGEGYGRPLAEFCLSKKPVITTAWSGHVDFLNPEFSVLLPGTLTKCHPSALSQGLIIEGASWFSVDTAATSRALIDVFENYSKYEVMGKRQGHKIKTEFNYDNMVLLLGSYLEKYVPKQVVLNLPKLIKVS
jgi:glycosyltransferase involved in cell wall biosynthesis